MNKIVVLFEFEGMGAKEYDAICEDLGRMTNCTITTGLLMWLLNGMANGVWLMYGILRKQCGNLLKAG
jgi:hypothetical protein